jgi:hypothetical protein
MTAISVAGFAATVAQMRNQGIERRVRIASPAVGTHPADTMMGVECKQDGVRFEIVKAGARFIQFRVVLVETRFVSLHPEIAPQPGNANPWQQMRGD